MKILTLFLSLMFVSRVGYTHPHNWIGLHTRFVLDDKARLVQVKQRWEFDFYYSLMMHADLLNEFGSEDIGLPATADDMIKNLASYGYFSSLVSNESKIELGVPKNYRLTTKESDGQLILVLDMTFELNQKIFVENGMLEWQVFDPTYYIAMNHETENNIEVIGGNATECSTTLKFPEPSDELMDYAQSLDRTQKNTDGLGAKFAETAYITCV